MYRGEGVQQLNLEVSVEGVGGGGGGVQQLNLEVTVEEWGGDSSST